MEADDAKLVVVVAETWQAVCHQGLQVVKAQLLQQMANADAVLWGQARDSLVPEVSLLVVRCLHASPCTKPQTRSQTWLPFAFPLQRCLPCSSSHTFVPTRGQHSAP